MGILLTVTAPLIGFMNPAHDSKNLGDEIIWRSVEGIFRPALTPLVTVGTHTRHTSDELDALSKCDVVVIGGSNLLASTRWASRFWPLSRAARTALAGKCVLIGVGWWQYQRRPSRHMGAVHAALLHPGLPQSVRDEYTRTQLLAGGTSARVYNTSCPTTWSIPSESTAAARPDKLLLTLTDYNKAIDQDSSLIKAAVKNFGDGVVFWAQGSRDLAYARHVGLPANVRVLHRSVGAVQEFLREESTAHLGTRLHGGILALQHGRPSLTIAVDNRATEIARDTSLLVAARGDLETIESWLARPTFRAPRLPADRQLWAGAFAREIGNDLVVTT